jgi:hypothetical protein
MSLTVEDGATITKDPADKLVFHFDWDASNLGTAVTISGTPTVTVVNISGDAVTTPVTVDQVSVLSGSRKVQCRINAGAVGSYWAVTNQIVTNESVPQTKERSVYVLVEQR